MSFALFSRLKIDNQGKLHAGEDSMLHSTIVTEAKQFEKAVKNDFFYDFSIIG